MIEAWDSLPEAVKAGILAMVKQWDAELGVVEIWREIDARERDA